MKREKRKKKRMKGGPQEEVAEVAMAEVVEVGAGDEVAATHHTLTRRCVGQTIYHRVHLRRVPLRYGNSFLHSECLTMYMCVTRFLCILISKPECI